jgi:hypothetical protein
MANTGTSIKRAATTLFWLWILCITVAAFIIGGAFYFFGELSGIPIAAIAFFLLGIPQSLILQRYARRGQWSQWYLLNSVACVVVIPLALIVVFVAQAGGGLNPETDVRGCFIQGAAVLGFVFGTIQNAHSDVSLIWGCVHAIAFTIGAWVGGSVGFWIFHSLSAPTGYDLSHASHRATGIAAGFLVGLIVYGLITALSVAYSVRSSDNEALLS